MTARREATGLDPMPSPAKLRELLERRTGRREPAGRRAMMTVVVDAKRPATTEHDEQAQLFAWAEGQQAARWPELALLYAIPNFAGRLGRLTAKQGARLKAEGRKVGVPDICLPVARGRFHGLYIELKTHDGHASAEQKEWCMALRDEGYRAEIVHGWESARDLIVRYLNG